MIETMHQWQRAFVDEGVYTCAQPVGDHVNELTVLERDVIASSVAIRRNTYSTGRFCAKKALAEINISASDYFNGLIRQTDGSVAWPAGAIGSISHTNDWAVAAVAPSGGNLVSLGIDLEQIDRVDKDVLRLIATEQERTTLESMVELRWGRVALFSIKESIYKCLRPIFGEFIRFKDVQIANLTSPMTKQSSPDEAHSDIEVYCPTVKLCLPALAEICDEERIHIRLVILPSHVLSYVSYHA